MVWAGRKTIHSLRRGEVIDLEGIKLKMVIGPDGQEEEIRPGDLYVAEHFTGPKLLTAKRIVAEHQFIIPTCDAYPYNTPECVKVCEA